MSTADAQAYTASYTAYSQLFHRVTWVDNGADCTRLLPILDIARERVNGTLYYRTYVTGHIIRWVIYALLFTYLVHDYYYCLG